MLCPIQSGATTVIKWSMGKMDWDDVEPKKAPVGAIGDNLENMSVAELVQRITDLQDEVQRVEKERDRKLQLGAAADQVFKS